MILLRIFALSILAVALLQPSSAPAQRRQSPATDVPPPYAPRNPVCRKKWDRCRAGLEDKRKACETRSHDSKYCQDQENTILQACNKAGDNCDQNGNFTDQRSPNQKNK